MLAHTDGVKQITAELTGGAAGGSNPLGRSFWAWALRQALVCLAWIGATAMAQDGPGDAPVKKTSVQVSGKWPPYELEIWPKAFCVATIRISGGPKRDRGQTFDIEVEDEKRPGFFPIDVNLDGYTDLAFVENRGATGNMNYTYVVFDPRRRVFVQNGIFDQITEVDKEKKELIAHSKLGGGEMMTQYYKVRNGKPIITLSEQITRARDVRDVVPASYKDDQLVCITKIYKVGRLSRTFYTDRFDSPE